jgi:hypothetical protein
MHLAASIAADGAGRTWSDEPIWTPGDFSNSISVMRALIAVPALVLIASSTLSLSASAHGVGKVRRELSEQGFDQLEFSRTRPPFKLDACRGGERFHLHVDFYGKITEQTRIGSCAEEKGAIEEDAAINENSSITTAAPDGVSKPPRNVEASAPPSAKEELCARYMAGIGRTISVPCDE